GLEFGLIRRIEGVGYGVLEFLRVGTTFDYLPEYSHNISSIRRIDFFWIQPIDLHYFVLFGECRHGYVVSSLMDAAYWSSE
ncbi:hypothetical protein Tco_1510837, partial [Tanacetum coccineum]